MAANTKPIFTLTPKNGFAVWTPSITANVKSDGTGTIGTDILVAFTAGANGAFVNKVRFIPNASAATTATTATVARVYRSTKTSGSTTNADTFHLDEVALAAQTADQATVANNFLEIQLGVALAANETILVSMHHVPATNTSWHITVFGSDY